MGIPLNGWNPFYGIERGCLMYSGETETEKSKKAKSGGADWHEIWQIQEVDKSVPVLTAE
jgi:hypothetical protein